MRLQAVTHTSQVYAESSLYMAARSCKFCDASGGHEPRPPLQQELRVDEIRECCLETCAH